MPDIRELRSIDLEQPLLIGSLVSVNAACNLVETESRTISANDLEELGTSRSYWKKSQRQFAAQGGQYFVCQATETWNKQTGILMKDRALAYPPQVLIQYLDFYWGVQVSYCTGVAKRGRLRRLIADLIPHFSAGTLFYPNTLEAKLNDGNIRPKEVQAWLGGLSPGIRAEILNVIFSILDTLRYTGLDSTDTFFCVAWPFEGNITQCFKVPLDNTCSWARFMADSHDCATFAYITMECFETTDFKCSGTPTACDSIFSLETAVTRIRKEEALRPSLLQHHETCFFSKQDNMFWVNVLKENNNQAARLVQLISVQKLRYSLRQRLMLSIRFNRLP